MFGSCKSCSRPQRLLLASSAVDALNTYSERSPESTVVYESYVSEHVLGEYTDTTRKYLSDRRTELSEITSDSKFDDMKYDYLDGKIDSKKYTAFLAEVGSAEAELRVIRSISERVDALSSAAAVGGAAVWLISETGILRIIGRDIKLFLLAAVVFILSRAYAADWSGTLYFWLYEIILADIGSSAPFSRNRGTALNFLRFY